MYIYLCKYHIEYINLFVREMRKMLTPPTKNIYIIVVYDESNMFSAYSADIENVIQRFGYSLYHIHMAFRVYVQELSAEYLWNGMKSKHGKYYMCDISELF